MPPATTEYNNDDVHHEVGEYNASICRPELDRPGRLEYDGDAPLNVPGQVRHSAMFVWTDEADDAAKPGAWEPSRPWSRPPTSARLRSPRTSAADSTDYDWIMDVQVTEPGGDQGADRGRGLR